MNDFLCKCCGQTHAGPPMSYGIDAPQLWSQLSWLDKLRSTLTRDRCIVKDEHFFVCGSLEIPVVDSSEPFVWTVWVSLSKTNFERAGDLWTNPDRIHEPPYFGWFSNSLPIYPPTLHLKTNVHSRAVGVRPYIELEETDHPLAVEQREGITMARVTEIAELVLHPRG